jgi:hypothetical protein
MHALKLLSIVLPARGEHGMSADNIAYAGDKEYTPVFDT